MKIKEQLFKVLNGMSLGIVVTLIPSAILGEVTKLLGLTTMFSLTRLSTSLLPVAIGIGVASQFGMNPLETMCIAMASVMGSGVVSFANGTISLVGTGDVVNAGVTAFVAYQALKFSSKRVKTLGVVVLPTFIVPIVGYIGLQILPIVANISGGIGTMIEEVVKMQPLLTGGVIAVIYSVLIISPFSTVGIALAVGLSGIAAGSANLGVCAAAFGMFLASFKVNPLGITLVPILGSPKIQMSNFVKNPLILIPVMINAFILGVLGAIFNIQGTAFSAGFGISGFIGPINALNHMSWTASNIALVGLLFIGLPLVLGYIGNLVFVNKLSIVKAEDYRVII